MIGLDLLKDLLMSPAGSFGSMFALFSFFMFLVYKAGKIVEKYKVVNVIQNNIDKIKEDISEIKAFIQVFKQNTNPFAKAQSPISLTELGTQVAEDLQVKRIIKKNWIELEKKITTIIEKDSNPYNIQEACFKIGKKYSAITSKEEYDFIKKYVFEKGYNLYDLDLIFGIILRDEFFSKKGINIIKVDHHSPNKDK